MSDPRIDTLGNAAILTDTQFRLAFAPHDEKAPVVAMKVNTRQSKINQMQAMMKVGTIHLQVKAGFGKERHVELTGPELMVLMDMADRFVTELPGARQAKPIEEN